MNFSATFTNKSASQSQSRSSISDPSLSGSCSHSSNPNQQSQSSPSESSQISKTKQSASNSSETQHSEIDAPANFPMFLCELHSSKPLTLICTFPPCPLKGLICNLCQHSDHFSHSEYCVPLEVFFANLQESKARNLNFLREAKLRFTAINNRSKQILNSFLMRIGEVYSGLLNEIKKNTLYEIHLMDGIKKRDREICMDLKTFDGDLRNYNFRLRSRLEKMRTEIYPKNAEKVSFGCPENEENMRSLQEIERKSQEFELYLKERLGNEEKRLGSLSGMDQFKRTAKSFENSTNQSKMKKEINSKEKSQSKIFKLFKYR